jgi:arginase family enzyme
MLIDDGDVDARDVTLLHARNLDPPEAAFIAEAGIRMALGPLPERVYVALDGDALAPGELDVLMSEPGGPTLEEVERLLASLPRPVGAGFSGLTRSPRNEAALARLGRALDL